ncbi:hypothetical protein [Leifsonia sp. TF02-11]|uniref:hypothetical protein n=1 Tax=Leifsonia sp. TF02-11 TaxID=2815212 RepID=UPI001AA19A55|nr:hypothetical protein [Leifsonia sp. TF02-11]MBO1738004.1 hypothetical protein [Leifsonia sp. TF02-11]
MQNLSTTYAKEIRDRGKIFVPAGRSHTAFIDARDIGAVAAAVFTSAGHDRKASPSPVNSRSPTRPSPAS